MLDLNYAKNFNLIMPLVFSRKREELEEFSEESKYGPRYFLLCDLARDTSFYAIVL
jgi:hypothetical protein